MAERDELARTLCSHDAGELGSRKRVAFRQRAQPLDGFACHADRAASDRTTPERRLVSDIDHLHRAGAFIDVG